MVIYHLPTCNAPRFNLSVITFLIPLLPSSAAKISFSNNLLISETIVHFTAKISIAFYWSIDLETLTVFSLRLHMASNSAGYEKRFSRKTVPATTRVWSKINWRWVTVTNEPVSRSSTTSLAFSQQNISSFQLVRNIEGYRSGWKLKIRKDRLQNIGIEKAWTCTCTHSRNGNEPNARNKKLFRIKWMQRC